MSLSRLIRLVEDNPNDVELTMRALRTNRITTEVVVVHHGVEALDFCSPEGPMPAAAPSCNRIWFCST